VNLSVLVVNNGFTTIAVSARGDRLCRCADHVVGRYASTLVFRISKPLERRAFGVPALNGRDAHHFAKSAVGKAAR